MGPFKRYQTFTRARRNITSKKRKAKWLIFLQETLKRERKYSFSDALSVILLRRAESTRLVPTSMACLDAKLVRLLDSHTLMPIRTKVSPGLKTPSGFILRIPRNISLEPRWVCWTQKEE